LRESSFAFYEAIQRHLVLAGLNTAAGHPAARHHFPR